uniref:Uncharacterized protein n=1 Tax=Caenorhabditis japonica TaxID=281687 RepID=A0A8R1I4G1_CAEJA
MIPIYRLIHYIQLTSFVCSQCTNALLLYLIWAYARKVLGAYRYLMIAFSIYAIVYNYVDMITQPLVVVEKQMYAVVNHGMMRYTGTLGFVLVCTFFLLLKLR